MSDKVNDKAKRFLNLPAMGATVLRSVNISRRLDEILRVLAFHLKQTKQELIVRLLERGVEQYRDQLEKLAPGLLPPLQDKSAPKE